MHVSILYESSVFEFFLVLMIYFMHLNWHFMTGTLVLLKHPYPKVVEEPDNYEEIVLQSTVRSGATEKDLEFQTKADSVCVVFFRAECN